MPFEPKLSERKQGNFKLNQDVRSEFIRTARANQLRQSMEYLIDIIDSFALYTESLEARIEQLEKTDHSHPHDALSKSAPAPDNAIPTVEEAQEEAKRPVKRAAKKAAAKPEDDAE